MMPLEDMLTTAFREKAADIQPAMVPPLRPDAPAPSQAPGHLAPGRRAAQPARRSTSAWHRTGRRPDVPRPRRWLAPAASAVLVLAVIAGAVVVSRGITVTRAPEAGTTGVPPYYVALTGPPSSGAATVRATTTGTVLARVAPPRSGSQFVAVTGAADDRTFVLAALTKTRHLTKKQLARLAGFRQLIREEDPALRFYVLRLGPAGRIAQLQALPALDMPAGSLLSQIALSPDGTRLAVDASPTNRFKQSRLQVLNLVTGARRSWSTELSEDEQPGWLAWTADNRNLSFIWWGKGPEEVRLLRVSAPGSSLLANSRPIALPRTGLRPSWQAGFITPDGKTIIAIREFMTQDSLGLFTSWQDLLRYSATTRTKPTVLSHHLAGYIEPDQVLWTSNSGRTLVVTGTRPGITAGILRGHRYTRIPWSADIATAAW